jgi:hypothetical protein
MRQDCPFCGRSFKCYYCHDDDYKCDSDARGEGVSGPSDPRWMHYSDYERLTARIVKTQCKRHKDEHFQAWQNSPEY